VKEESKKENQLQREKIAERVKNKQHIQNQMQEREKLKEEAYQEYLKEKNAVDEAINKMIAEDRSEIGKKAEKTKTMQEFMARSMKAKEELQRKTKDDERTLLEKIKKYQEEGERREAEIKMKRAEESAAKEQIFAKLNEEEIKRRTEKEYIENLRIDLMQEEFEENERQKEKLYIEKREQ
jgi:hypothetical protein